ncbi:alanine racemase [Brachybacterium phenoliresistens]|uniref:alanine racemase n=1 Tax=Brachybacterium phenoliresistens TaxID=396014 RepID=UPI0031E3599B
MTLENLDALRVGPAQKSLPEGSAELTVRELLDRGLHLSDLTTPVLALTGSAMEANIALLAQYCARHGVALAPHGKTTMAPDLWRRQIEAGAWGVTVANPAQLAVARAAGIARVQLANCLVDPHGIALAQAMAAEGVEVLSWVDDLAAVARLARHLAADGPALDVLVELGAPGGRTGARGIDAAREVAAAVHASPRLRLRGVAGYEGALAHDRSAEGLAAVTAYLEDMRALLVRLAAEGLLDAEEIVLTAGGSAYFDLVVDRFAGVGEEVAASAGELRTTVMLRSGAYIVHDDGFYRGITPLGAGTEGGGLVPAMHAWVRVLSRPEPTLALLDGGKRDLSFDEGLPEPQRAMPGFGAASRRLEGARATAMNDQHTFLEIPADDPLAVGDVVRLGLSHPCTALDKWRLIPVIDDAEAADPAVTALLRTYF